MRRIARVLGLSRGLVTHYYKAEAFPERKSHYVPSQLDPYLGYLEQRVAEGCWNSPQLWREICTLGYPGRPSQVTKWVQVRRRNSPGASAESQRSNAAPLPFALPPLPTCLHLLVAQPSHLSGEEQIRLAQLQEIPALRTLYDFVQTFAQIVRQRQSERLDAWLADCHGSRIAAFQRFAASLKQDYAAVKAALELPWSNGQTEGQIHRLKCSSARCMDVLIWICSVYACFTLRRSTTFAQEPVFGGIDHFPDLSSCCANLCQGEWMHLTGPILTEQLTQNSERPA